MGVSAKVEGIPDMRQALLSIPAKLRYRALRNSLAAGARIVRDAARSKAPVLQGSAKFRKPGTLKKAIVVRTSKVARSAGDVGVFVNVRPAKRGQRGARSQNDPFYWRWQEFGWTPASGPRTNAAKRARRKANRTTPAIPGRGFLQSAGSRLNDALKVFIDKIGPQIEKLNGGKGVGL